MSKVNLIQSKIMELEGGAFESLFDAYLLKRYRFNNIQTLGVQAGTNKPTKGTPDTYVKTEDEKYILINYGSVKSQPAAKIKADILSCFDSAKLKLEKSKVKKIICGHCSTNIHIEQYDEIIHSIEGVEIELIGIDKLSHDLAFVYPHIAKDYLGIEIDTNQFFDIDDFVKVYDANGINAPIGCNFLHRKDELNEICQSLCDNKVTILIGKSGIGKTRLAVEACRIKEREGLKVFCIHNNGNMLYEDIKYYIDTPGEYLIFFDDANMVVSINNILHTLMELPIEYDVKLLFTVRDYAKERVIDSVSEFISPNIIEISRFTDEEIKELLKDNLGILNQDYLKKISEIAEGNSRLALLAGMRAVEEGYPAIYNVEDIFKNYYGRIIKDIKLTKNDVLMLFFITVAGPVLKGKNLLYTELLQYFGKTIIENEEIEKLYNNELIDWFKNKITKISDQSFGNYILYYVLIEKKWISIESIIKIGFPKYRNKIINVLNTLTEIFKSDEVIQYVTKSIISAWDNAHDENEMAYLESFCQVNPDKSLSIIKKHIEQDEYVELDLHNFDIGTKKNYNHIYTKEIEILGGYKYSKHFNDSIDLLLRYYKKRPDLVMDFYFTICNGMLYDKYSSMNKYNCEKIVLEKLWESTEGGVNYNNSLLYIHIADYALKTQFSYTENIKNKRAFNYVTMAIGFTKEIAELRNSIFKSLGILRKRDEYNELVNKIITKVNLSGLDENDLQEFLQSDFNTIYTYIIDKGIIGFYDAIIIDRYREIAEEIGIPIDERYQLAENNNVFRIYKLLSREHFLGNTFEEDEITRKDRIEAEILSYNLDDYDNLFSICHVLEESVYRSNQWALDTGLDIVFEILEKDFELYVNVIKAYLEANAPFSPNKRRIVQYLLSNLGYDNTYNIVNKIEFSEKDTWILNIWECMDESMLSDTAINDFKAFSLKYLKSDNNITPSVHVLRIFGDRDEEIKSDIIKKIKESPNLSLSFLGFSYNDQDIEALLDIFKDNYNDLAEIYINAIQINFHIDYGGQLFMKIFGECPHIWKEYVDWIKDNIKHDGYEQKIFDQIWSCEEWRECINYAYTVLLEESRPMFIEYPAKLIFGKSNNTTDYILEKKKQWLIEKLHKNISNLGKSKLLIEVVVNVMKEWKLDFILEYLTGNKNIDDFKKINLFPLSASWSGSEIPLVLDKIQFLQLLKERLIGADYIDHRNYLDELCRNLEKKKEKIELDEYLEEAKY